MYLLILFISNMGGPQGHYARLYKKDRYHMIMFICGI